MMSKVQQEDNLLKWIPLLAYESYRDHESHLRQLGRTARATHVVGFLPKNMIRLRSEVGRAPRAEQQLLRDRRSPCRRALFLSTSQRRLGSQGSNVAEAARKPGRKMAHRFDISASHKKANRRIAQKYPGEAVLLRDRRSPGRTARTSC